MTLSRFIETMRRSGLERRYLALNALTDVGSPARRAMLHVMDALSRVPGLREYFTQNVYGVWRLPATR